MFIMFIIIVNDHCRQHRYQIQVINQACFLILTFPLSRALFSTHLSITRHSHLCGTAVRNCDASITLAPSRHLSVRHLPDHICVYSMRSTQRDDPTISQTGK